MSARIDSSFRKSLDFLKCPFGCSQALLLLGPSMTKAKIISILGVIAAATMAVAPQFTSMSPKTAQWILLAGALATAIGGSLTSHLADRIWPTVIGAGIAGSSVLAGATGLLPSRWVFIAGVAGTVLAALGRSLFGWMDSSPKEPAINPREWRS